MFAPCSHPAQPSCSTRRKEHEVKIDIEIATTVDIDPKLWASEYGIDESEVEADVKAYYEQILWRCAETFNRTGAHQL